jgi:hypothetical protein
MVSSLCLSLVFSVEVLTRSIDDVLGGVDIAEVEPQRAIETARVIQPAQEPAGQSRLAYSA